MAATPLSTEQFYALLAQGSPSAPPAPAEQPGAFGSAFPRTAGQYIQGFGRGLEDLGLSTGIDEYGAELMAKYPAQINSLSDIVESPGTFAAEAGGEGVSSLGANIPARALGGGLGWLVARAPGAWLGQQAGSILSGALPAYGGIREGQDAAGVDDKARALGGALASGAVESLGLERLVGRFLPGGAVLQPGASRLGAAAKGGLGSGLTEMVTEGAIQGPIEQWASYQDPLSPESIQQNLVGAAKGFGGGVAVGAPLAALQPTVPALPAAPPATMPAAAAAAPAPSAAVGLPTAAPQPVAPQAPAPGPAAPGPQPSVIPEDAIPVNARFDARDPESTLDYFAEIGRRGYVMPGDVPRGTQSTDVKTEQPAAPTPESAGSGLIAYTERGAQEIVRKRMEAGESVEMIPHPSTPNRFAVRPTGTKPAAALPAPAARGPLPVTPEGQVIAGREAARPDRSPEAQVPGQPLLTDEDDAQIGADPGGTPDPKTKQLRQTIAETAQVVPRILPTGERSDKDGNLLSFTIEGDPAAIRKLYPKLEGGMPLPGKTGIRFPATQFMAAKNQEARLIDRARVRAKAMDLAAAKKAAAPKAVPVPPPVDEETYIGQREAEFEDEDVVRDLPEVEPGPEAIEEAELGQQAAPAPTPERARETVNERYTARPTREERRLQRQQAKDEEAGQTPLFSRQQPETGKPLRRIRVKRPAVDGNGNQVEIEQRADRALEDVDQQITAVKELISCLRS